MPKMEIKSWKSRKEKIKLNVDGNVAATINTWHGVVEYFSFAGDSSHDAFTTMYFRVCGMTFYCTIDRFYSPRWARRLCSEFTERCVRSL